MILWLSEGLFRDRLARESLFSLCLALLTLCPSPKPFQPMFMTAWCTESSHCSGLAYTDPSRVVIGCLSLLLVVKDALNNNASLNAPSGLQRPVP